MFSKNKLNQTVFRLSDWDNFMETCIRKPLLMHLTLNCVFFFRSSSKHENRTHFGVIDENGMKSNEKKTIHIASQLKKRGLTSSLLLEMFFHLDKQTSVKHLTALKSLFCSG